MSQSRLNEILLLFSVSKKHTFFLKRCYFLSIVAWQSLSSPGIQHAHVLIWAHTSRPGVHRRRLWDAWPRGTCELNSYEEEEKRLLKYFSLSKTGWKEEWVHPASAGTHREAWNEAPVCSPESRRASCCSKSSSSCSSPACWWGSC